MPYVAGTGNTGRFLWQANECYGNLAVGTVYDQIEKYEPRAVISEVRFETDHLTGKLIVVVELEGVKENG